MSLSVMYTIPELCAATGLPSRRLRRELRELGVPLRRRSGQRTHRVYLADLVSFAPDIVTSMRMKAALEADDESTQD